MQIAEVRTQRDLAEFINLPYRVYRKDAQWVAPLRSDQWNQFNPRMNPMLDHCEYMLYLLQDGGRVIGRISAFVDRLAIDAWKQPVGLFGSFECPDDPDAARLLLGAAQAWLASRGMSSMRGPWSFASQEWGLVVEGFSPPPVILAPYNPPFYNNLLTGFGMEKAKDLLVYYIDTREGYAIPERYLTVTDRVRERLGIRIRHADLRHLEREVGIFVQLANESIADNWGFYPVTDAEAKAIARDLKAILDPRAVLFAEDPQGNPIGFAMALPDVNLLLKGLDGRLFPFGWLRLLFGLPRLRQYRMWALGVVPAYQGKAVDALMYRALYETFGGKPIRLEINYVLEDNVAMNNALKNLGVKPLRRYRVYQTPIR